MYHIVLCYDYAVRPYNSVCATEHKSNMQQSVWQNVLIKYCSWN